VQHGSVEERFWDDQIRTRYRCQTVATVCRIPRVFRLREARNLRHFELHEYETKLADGERELFPISNTRRK
jgi:hypothetical protein